MANEDGVARLRHAAKSKAGNETWNSWRKKNDNARLDLRAADLAGLVFNDSTSYVDLDLSNVDLSDANFSGAQLESVSFENSNLKYANFSDTTLKAISFRRADLCSAIFDSSTMAPRVSFRYAEMRAASCQRIEACEVSFAGADLEACDFSCSTMRETDFSQANMSEVKLYRCDLYGSNLERVSLIRAKLEKTDLRGTKVSGADFTDARVSWADFRGIYDLSQEQLDKMEKGFRGDEPELSDGLFL